MGHFVGSRWLILLMAVLNIEAQKKPPINIRSKCLGNVLRVTIDPIGGDIISVAASINGSTIPLTQSVASQCGFSVNVFPLGNTIIYASVQNCFAQNVEDEAFTIALTLRLHGNQMVEDELYQVVETCYYSAWVSREILCERDYMEVSVSMPNPDDYALPKHPIPRTRSKFGDPRRAADSSKVDKQPSDKAFRITTVVFLTPEEKAMTVVQAQRKGYGVTNSPTRLVLRSPKTAPETYIQDVAGVPMTVLKTSTLFEKMWLVTQIDAEAACPTPMGGVSFTPESIFWYLPWHIDPLISSTQFELLEVHMGIEGEILDLAEMEARHYSMSFNDKHVIVEIPIGAVGGYFKSHVEDDQYLTSYSIEPMLELLWIEKYTPDKTRYKVLFHITTPPMSRPLQVTDNTIPEERMFKVVLGPLGTDVALLNITFSTGVLSVADCIARGFNLLEHEFHNSSKAITLDVPFTDPVVLQRKDMGTTFYSLQLTFGLLVLPEFAPFAHTAHLDAALVDIVPPFVSSSCEYTGFYVTVRYGTHGVNFQTIVGTQMLTPALAQEYGFVENGTHFGFAVPFAASDVVFEAIESSSIRNRLVVTLRDPETNVNIHYSSVSCRFLSSLTECLPNGTITALAIKLESVPNLNLSQLTLRDPSCGPAFSDDRFAYFVFCGSCCNTTRRFYSNVMVYENDISLPYELEVRKDSETEEPEYELRVSCFYDIGTTHTVAFLTRPRSKEPYVEPVTGELLIAMRLAIDKSYSLFYRDEEYPLAQYLSQPLYFELELMRSTNPEVTLELEHCWATLNDDRTSQPRWNLIINGCVNPVDPNQVLFHPVLPDARVQHPSHFKRFEVQMFAFAVDQDNLSSRLFVHCDVVICDVSKPKTGPCGGCRNEENSIKGQRRDVSDVQSFKEVSSGPLFIMQSK